LFSIITLYCSTPLLKCLLQAMTRKWKWTLRIGEYFRIW